MIRLCSAAAAIWAAVAASSPAAPLPASATGCENTAMTTPAMTACAAGAARKADAHLDAAYREVLRYVDGTDRDRLIAAQRAWIAFRDTDCAFFGAGDGTVAPMNHAYCLAGLSEARAKELDGWPPNAPRDALAPPPR